MICSLILAVWIVCGAVAYCIEQDRAQFPFNYLEFVKSCAWGVAALWAVTGVKK